MARTSISVINLAACHTSPRDYGFSSGGLAVLRRTAFELEALLITIGELDASRFKRPDHV
jgi:hypothetical protein